MRYSRRDINRAFRHCDTIDAHSDTCGARIGKETLNKLREAGIPPSPRERVTCTCGAVEQALRELATKKPPTDKVGGRAAMRRRVRDIAERARKDAASDEAALMRAAEAEFATWHDEPDYQIMAWHEQMRRHGWSPAQRVEVQGALATITGCTLPEPTEAARDPATGDIRTWARRTVQRP